MIDIEIPGYHIERELGHGGMATVYLAVQTSLDRRVAIKLMATVLAADRSFSDRFLKEARTAARLQNPGIVAIHDTGVVGHHHYIAMEYVAGGELKDRLRSGAMPPKKVARIVGQIADALAYAHEKGFVHRDVKPENILFRDNGHAVLTDFGIARAMGTGTRMTATGLSIGTPHYMSPEQARGKEVDGRSDLYALGIVFHEMLTGKVPFDAQDSFAVGLMHMNDEPPKLPSELQAYQPILDKLLAKKPDERYQSGTKLVTDLDRLEKGEAIEPPRRATRVIKKADHGSGITDQGRKAGHGITESGNHGSSGAAGSRAGLYWALGGGALALVLAAGIYIWQEQSSPTSPIGGSSTTASRPAPAESDSATPETRNPKPETVSSGNAILHIETTPEGAEIFLNDESIGTTPFQSEEMPAGEHRLRLAHRYYEPWEQTVRLEDDVVDRVNADLKRGRGRVTVITEPPEAEVWIDGEPQEGTTPVTVSGLTSGDQQLEIRLPRYRTITRTVEILPSDTARLDLTLEGGDLHEWDGRWLTGEEVIPLLLEAAETDLEATRLMAPEGDNAWEKYQRVLDIDQDHLQARAGIERIAERYVELADAAVADGELERADAFLANAETAGASGSAYDRARSQLESARAERRGEQQRRKLISEIQTELARLGREVRATGTLDTPTVEAIRAYERAAEIPERGEATEALVASLEKRERWPGPQPGDAFRDCPDCPEMVFIPAGSFMMGSPSDEPQRDDDEGPQHLVTLPAFAMGGTEVTFEQWNACVAAGGCSHRPDDEDWGEGDRPVINVSWNDAQEYVEWLSRKTGQEYRLPSESEWEYAARAGTTTRFHTGDCITLSQAHVSLSYPPTGCSEDNRGKRGSIPVGSFAANAFGLYDMHGNVWEWVEDCYSRSYNGAPSDGSARKSNCTLNYVVQRGGSWNNHAPQARSASRRSSSPDRRKGISGWSEYGFRIARSVRL